MTETTEPVEAAPFATLRDRIAAFMVDCSVVFTTALFALVWWTVADDTSSTDVVSGPAPANGGTLEDPVLHVIHVLLTFALVMYVFFMGVLALRCVAILAFGTTPGRKLTGLRVVMHEGGRLPSRVRVAFREILALLYFALPLMNLIWIFVILADFSLGWHERDSKTTVVRAS